LPDGSRFRIIQIDTFSTARSDESKKVQHAIDDPPRVVCHPNDAAMRLPHSSSIILGSALLTILFVSGCDNASDQTVPEETTTVPGANCPAPACPGAAAPTPNCTSHATVPVSKYNVVNNLWGLNQAGVSGQQCVWSVCDSGTAIGWGTSWDWQANTTSVPLSYSAVMLGWHWSSIAPNSGLPVLLSDNRKVNCTWSYRFTQHRGIAFDIAYDLWVAPTATPNSGTTPTDEIMIWLNHLGAGPIGMPVGTMDIAGARWTLFEGKNNWQVHSFVRADNVNCATFNLMDFFNELIQKHGFDSSKYLIGIEAGPEIYVGTGELDSDYYSCDIQ
jgi:xyloglucan-specific endo-beta-1,4-glucanase